MACIRSGDTLARVGGDEFVVLCEDVDRPEDYSLVAQKIIETLSCPMIIQSHTVHVGASLGIAIFPDDGIESIALMKSADTAMYAAKQAGRGKSCFFQAKMSEEAAVRMKMEGCLPAVLIIERKGIPTTEKV
jgi:diguanylate cyclase (GGDEF)-like protein